MRVIPVLKMSGTGNDFLLVDNRLGLIREGDGAALAQAACPRCTSAGADGVILLEKARTAGHDFRMRIYNADGSEAEMCGNGSRCIAVFAHKIGAAGLEQRIETLAGSLNASVTNSGEAAKVQLSPPTPLELRKAVPVLGQPCDLYFIDTGVPHAVEFVPDVAAVNVPERGACIRYHDCFKPKGTNANFVQIINPSTIKVRTYERGVEGETLACGTGSTASAIAACLMRGCEERVKVLTSGGSTLTIHLQRQGNGVAPPFLEGAVDTIFKGEFYWRS